MTTSYISLGSNLGDRTAYLREALSRLECEPVSLRAVSPIYETAPVGGPRQGFYLNACASLTTTLSPVILLRRLQRIEASLGRVRNVRWGARTIDLDLLICGRVIMRTPLLDLPHPRMTERDFVLQPLSDIAPDLCVPGTGKTVSRLLEERPAAAGVALYRERWYPDAPGRG